VYNGQGLGVTKNGKDVLEFDQAFEGLLKRIEKFFEKKIQKKKKNMFFLLASKTAALALNPTVKNKPIF
jgi:hypothetical protein